MKVKHIGSYGLHPKKISRYHRSARRNHAQRMNVISKNVHNQDVEVTKLEPVMLGKAVTQWQFGDWDSLSKITFNDLENSEDRGKLSILVALAWLQLGDVAKGKEYIVYSLKNGCHKDIVLRLLASGVYQSLGTVDKVLGNSDSALEKFRQAIEIASPNTDTKLFGKLRYDNFQEIV